MFKIEENTNSTNLLLLEGVHFDLLPYRFVRRAAESRQSKSKFGL